MTLPRCLIACGLLLVPTGIFADPIGGAFTLGFRQFEDGTALSSGTSAWFGLLDLGGSFELGEQTTLEYSITQSINFETDNTTINIDTLDLQWASDDVVLSVGRGALGWSRNSFTSPSNPFFVADDDILDFKINAQNIDRVQFEYHSVMMSIELVASRFDPTAPSLVFGTSAAILYDLATFDGSSEAHTQYGLRLSPQIGVVDVSVVLADAYERPSGLVPNGFGTFIPNYAKSLRMGLLVEGELSDTGILFDFDYG